jgi:FkbM family methyltransferase
LTRRWRELALRPMRILRRALPSSARRRVRQLMFEWLNLTWPLESGIFVRVGTYGNWIVYNEIFVEGVYDEAIDRALDTLDGATTLKVLDLGANVGFFTLRVADRLHRRAHPPALSVVAVEGHDEWIEELRARLFVDNTALGETTVVHGLVGRRQGSAVLHAANSILRDPGAAGPLVPFVDLTTVAPSGTIDLLKCDIEGAEQLFIEEYGDLLRRTRVAVFELHADLCDVAACRDQLQRAGFTHHAAGPDDGVNSIYRVWR